MATLRHATRALLESGTREDVPTGTTPPRKRAWEYEETWERTKSRDEVLREWGIHQQLLEQQKRDDATRERQREQRLQAVMDTRLMPPPPSEPRERGSEPAEDTDDANTAESPALSPVLSTKALPLPAPAPAGVSRSSSRQSLATLGASQPLSHGRPSTKIGAPRRVASVKTVPLAEKGNVGSRTKRVR